MSKARLFVNFACTLLFFLGAWSIIGPNVNLDLDKVDQITSVVKRYALTSVLVSGRLSMRENVLEIVLRDYPYPFRVYKPLPKEKRLVENISVGDTLKIYFHKWDKDNYVNDVFQIAKKDRVLLDYKQYNKRHIYLAGVLVFIGVGCLVYSIHQTLKWRKSYR